MQRQLVLPCGGITALPLAGEGFADRGFGRRGFVACCRGLERKKQIHSAKGQNIGNVLHRRTARSSPKGPCTQVVYTLAPKYLCRDYCKANCIWVQLFGYHGPLEWVIRCRDQNQGLATEVGLGFAGACNL